MYGFKGFAFQDQLGLDEDMIDGLKQCFAFTSVVYFPHFLTSSIGCAINDLTLFKKLFEY